MTTDWSASGPLDGARLMLVEDEVILAIDMAHTLEEAGATVIGPFHLLDAAMEFDQIATLDAAILDVDLHGAEVFPLAERLQRARVPILFHTGRRHLRIDRFRRAALCPKPCASAQLVDAVTQLAASDAASREAVRVAAR